MSDFTISSPLIELTGDVFALDSAVFTVDADIGARDQVDFRINQVNIELSGRVSPSFNDVFLDLSLGSSEVTGDLTVDGKAAAEGLIELMAEIASTIWETVSGVQDIFFQPGPLSLEFEIEGNVTLDARPYDGTVTDDNILELTAEILRGLNSPAFIGLGDSAGNEFLDISLGSSEVTGDVERVGVPPSPPFAFFDSNNYLFHPDDTESDLNGGGNFSVAVLFDPEMVNNGTTGVIAGKHDPSNTQHGWRLIWDDTTGEVTALFSFSTNGANNSVRTTAVGGSGIRTRAIVVATWDGTTIELTVNGSSSQGSQTDTGTPGSMVTTTAVFAIGADDIATNPANEFRGAVMSVWIWDDTLTTGEAQSIPRDGTLPSALVDSNLKVEWRSDGIVGAFADSTFIEWIDRLSSLELLFAGDSRPIVLTAIPEHELPFSDDWGLDFVNDGILGIDTNLSSDYDLNSDPDDASETGTWRLYEFPGNVAHPEVASGYRDYKNDITVALIARIPSGSTDDLTLIEFFNVRVFYDGTSKDLFVFVGDTGTPTRYEFGAEQPISERLALIILRYNTVEDNIDIFMSAEGIKQIPEGSTVTGSPSAGTGIDFSQAADWRESKVVPACLSDEHIANLLSGFQAQAYGGEIETNYFRATIHQKEDPFDSNLTFPVLFEVDYSFNFLTGATDFQDPDTAPPTGTLELLDQPLDGDQFQVDDGTTTVTFEFNSGGGVDPGAIPVAIGASLEDTMDNLVTAVNGSALDIVASATVLVDTTGDGNTNHAYTLLTHNQDQDANYSLNIPIEIPENDSGNLIALGMFGERRVEESVPQISGATDVRLLPAENSGTSEQPHVDEPYFVLEPEDFDPTDGGGDAIINPLPVIISVTADESHFVTAIASAGPTNAGNVRYFWEVELVTNDYESVVRVDDETGLFATNRQEIDTFQIPLGQNWDEKRIRFVIETVGEDPVVRFESLFVRMLGDNFNNQPPETIIVPGNPVPDVPDPVELTLTFAQRSFVLDEEEAPVAVVLQVSNRSRYKLTRVFSNSRANPRIAGRNEDGLEFGLMSVLTDFTELSDDEIRLHTIRRQDIGFLDAVAVQFYGEGFEDLWWVLAYVNRIIDQETDMVVGEQLVIPSRERVRQFIARTPSPAGE